MICKQCGYDDNGTGDFAQVCMPLNLSDPAVQKRLATQWGYVPAELKLDLEHCPICDGTMRLYSRCTNKDCDAFTMTSVQSTYNKVRDFARTVATRLEEQPAPSVPDSKTIRDLLNESGLHAYDREGDLAFMLAVTKFAALLKAAPETKP